MKKFIGILALLAIIAGVVWWLGRDIEALNGEDGVYKTALDSAKDIANEAAKKAADANNAKNKTVTIYDGISVPLDAKILDLSSRNLEGSLNSGVQKLSGLTELDLDHNNLTAIPAEIGQLSNLEILDVSDNPITRLPSEIRNLKKIRVIDLRGTLYSKEDLDGIMGDLPECVQVLTDES